MRDFERGLVMKKDDFGFYGKGINGYVHYKQSFDETQKSKTDNPRHSSQKSQKVPMTKLEFVLMFLLYSGMAVVFITFLDFLVDYLS